MLKSDQDESTNKSILKHGTSLSLLTLLSRILGLVREMTKSAFMGTGPLADAFAVAFLIPNLLRRLFAENSITIAFIPTFKKYLSERENAFTFNEKLKNKQETEEFLSAIFTIISFLTTVVVILGIIFTPTILRLFFPKLTDDFTLTVLLSRIMFPYLTLISLAAFFQGILNGVRVFMPSGFTPILFNIIIIAATYALSDYFDNAAIAMSIGVTLGGVVQALFQLPFVLKTKFRFSFISLKQAFANEGTKQVFRLIIPTLFGMAAYQINDLVSSSLGKTAGIGVLSSLQYSMRLLELLLGVFAVSLGTVILPDLAGYATKKNWKEFQKVFLNAIKIIAVITIPASFFSLLSSEHIITLVYKAKSFDASSVALTMEAFRYHIIGLFFVALNRIVAPAFYAQSNSRFPAIAGFVSVLVNIAAAFALVGSMAGGGLALALSISSMANTLLLFFFLTKNPNLQVAKIIRSSLFSILKITVFSVIASIPIYFFGESIYPIFAGRSRIISEGIPLLINFFLFGSIGIFLLRISDDNSIKGILNKLKHSK